MRYALLLFLISAITLNAKILTVGTGSEIYEYDYLQQACNFAKPGDTILVFNSGNSDGEYIENLKGTENNYIKILAYETGKVEFKGNSQAWHLVDAEYVYIKGFVFSGQTGNGVNVDDGGSYDTPSKYVVFDSCLWKDMNATGNNDQLKMSGVDYFKITGCEFRNGSAGGSQIDMVGCHLGEIVDCKFIDGGSNAIQAKGGCNNLIIQRNWFENAGQRAINIGGSTGAEFFRPIDADYESMRIFVFANYFKGSLAPIAFVGTVNSAVFNNTIIKPDKWAIRILQENTNKQTCADNIFANNIVYISNVASNPTINVGGNTDPESFLFYNNLWYNIDNPSWAGPNLPAIEYKGIYKTDPQFVDLISYKIKKTSPAVAAGINFSTFINLNIDKIDYFKVNYNNPPSIGACEGNPADLGYWENLTNGDNIRIFPDPVNKYSKILFSKGYGKSTLELIDINGKIISPSKELNVFDNSEFYLEDFIDFQALSSGLYLLVFKSVGFNSAIPFMFFRE